MPVLYQLIAALCVKILKPSNKKNLLELISEFRNAPEHKINIQKSIVFLYINNWLYGKKKERKQSYSQQHQKEESLMENYETLMKD